MKPGVDLRMHRRLAPGGGGGEQRFGDGAVGGQPGDDLDQRHQRRRVEEMQAGQALGMRCSAAPMAVTEIDEVLVPRMQSRPTMPSRSANSVCLASQVLDDGFDDQRGSRPVRPDLGDREQARARGLRRLGCGQLAFFGHFRELGADAGDRARGRIGPVVEQPDRVAGGGRDLGDAGAHRAGADDGDQRLLGESAGHALTPR